MQNSGLLDLEPLPGKISGEFFFSDVQYGACQIMMSCRGTQHDLSMFFHEIGHVLQLNLMMDNPLYTYLRLPLDIREIASQAILYLSMKYWEDFYPDKSQLKLAVRHQFADDLIQLNKSLCLTQFQLELFRYPDWTLQQSEERFLQLWREYYPHYPEEYWSEFDPALWLREITVIDYPFYSIHTTLSLFAVWEFHKAFIKNPEAAVPRLHQFLIHAAEYDTAKLYETLGVKFDHTESHLKKCLDYVKRFL